MKIIIVIFILFVFSSCYTYKNGRLTPLYGKFKLKNKNTFIPERLDTNNLYKLSIKYKNGELVYSDSSKLKLKKNIYDNPYQEFNYYLKFFSDGRCQKFSTDRFDFYGNKIILTEEDLNPDNLGNIICYYYFKDEINFQIETFTKGDGSGAYVIIDYQLSQDGQKIIQRHQYQFNEYTLFKIPENWMKYNYDW